MMGIESNKKDRNG